MMDGYWNLPKIPRIVSKYEVGSGRVILNWDQTGSYYILQRSRSIDFSEYQVTWSIAEPSIVIENNPNSTNYFRVRSYTELGSRGWSLTEDVNVNQKPLPPIDLEAESLPEGGALLITWDWIGEDIDRAAIYVNVGEKELNTHVVYRTENEHLVRDLENDLEHSISMISIDRSGLISDLSEIIISTPIDTIPPEPPRNFVGEAYNNESIILEWDPPEHQDLWGYVIYRKDPGAEDFLEINRVMKDVLFYEDMDLMDNTTYDYAIASVDDDGPESKKSDPISVKTEHYNQRPIFAGTELILYMVEDEGTLKSDILDHFEDPDGDELTFSVLEFFPFFSQISDGILWIIPDKDQAGEGYVQISVSDGEESVSYLIGIIVEPVEDPPRDIAIVFPVNGSVLLPGASITMEGSGYDPDSENGDILSVTWSSDKQGILHQSTQSLLRAVVRLDPGVHSIELRVEDRSGNVAVDQIIVVVSLWGWGETPWSVSFAEGHEKVNIASPYVELDLQNDSPLILRFNINGELGAAPIDERSILVGPRSEGQITIQLPPDLKVGDDLSASLAIETQTLNGTFGGKQEVSTNFSMVSSNDGQTEDNVAIGVITVISVIALLGLAAYLVYIYRIRVKFDHKGD
jgi:fibronectin type 3 domain-containing protein